MPTTKYTDLAVHLRKWGLKVQEVPGWQNRSSNWSKSFDARGVVCHHTAGPTTGNYPSYNIVVNGRSDLTGPLSQFGLGRDGTVILIGGHRANHAGTGGPLVGIPLDSANAYMWGIEAENSGSQAWPAVQLQAYYRLCAALAAYPKASFPVSRVIGHKEWAPTRKIDPGGINMATFRTNVQKALNAGVVVANPPVAPAATFYGKTNGYPIYTWSINYATQSKAITDQTLADAIRFVAWAKSQHLVSDFNENKYTAHLHAGEWAQASVMFTSILKSSQRFAHLPATGKVDRKFAEFLSKFGYKVFYNG